MTLLWIVAGASLVAAVAAWSKARRTARRLEQISQMYWELKYQHGELRVQVQRLTTTRSDTTSPAPAPAGPGQPADSFVPLASLKR